MMRRRVHKFILWSATLLLYSCSGLHYVPEGKKLYTGAKVELQNTTGIKHPNALKTIAKNTIQPRPNGKILGTRFRLWMFYVTEKDTSHRFYRWLNHKIGEPPIYLSQVNPADISLNMDAALFNNGVFKAVTRYELKEHAKSAKILYLPKVHVPFIYEDIYFPFGDEGVQRVIQNSVNHSLIKKGKQYSLEDLKHERERLDLILKDSGYYFFRPDYIEFSADTLENLHSVKLEIIVKDETPSEALQVYHLSDVAVHQGFSIFSKGDTTATRDTVVQAILFTGDQRIRPRVIERAVFLRENERYSRSNHRLTLNHLMSMGAFKFASISYEISDTSAADPKLKAQIELTPAPKRTARIEMQLVSKSNDFAGPVLSLNYKNRNSFNGGGIL